MTLVSPSGAMTFLFTDVEGSTALWEERPDEMREALAEHDRIIRSTVASHGGEIFSTAGDSFAVAFESAAEALSAALDVQRVLRSPVGELVLRVRMGVHTGHAAARDGDYFGPEVNRCARLMSASSGGQILVSDATAADLAGRLPPGVGLVDLGEHRLKDLQDPERIHQVTHPDLDRDFPPLRTVEGPGDRLPVQLTSFVGRARELDEVRALLDRHRLVTLTGSGGAGKTRLAFQLGVAVPPVARDGVRLVELAALEDGDLFVEELASRFDVQAGPDRSLLDAVAESIGSRQILLILDNCEHLVDAAADASRHLLAACRGLRILATSRVRLGVHGEALYRVPSLTVPATDADVATSRTTDAVRLFVDRARLAVSDFEVTDTNLVHVVAICRRLDGIPLALELAAARVGVLSPAQIARRLDERFGLLAAPDPARSVRQQTLFAAIDWSHNLLDPLEQTLFRRLSAFVTDFSLDAAERVGAGGSIGELEVVDLLAALVDKSIVAPDRGADGEMRYRLLESMREYGLLRLDEAGERVDVWERYLDWCADLAEELQSAQRRGDLTIARTELEREEDHVRAALRFAIDTRRSVGAGRIVAAVGYLWYVAGLHREGIQWCRELVVTDPELPDAVRAGMLHTYGTLLGSWTRPDLGVELLDEEVELRRRIGDPVRLAAALNNLGNLLHDVGRFDDAERTLGEAIEHFRAAGESATLSLSSLAFGHMHTGGYARAEELYTEALEEAVAAGNEYGIALATEGLGQCVARIGRTARARALLEEGRARFSALRVLPGVADADFHLALVDRAEGHDDAAARHLLASLGTPGAHWYDEARAWIAQVAASVIDDAEDGALFIGAVAAWYDRSTVAPPVFIQADLAAARTASVQVLGADTFDRLAASGARLAPDELIDRVALALRRMLGDDADHTATVDPGDRR